MAAELLTGTDLWRLLNAVLAVAALALGGYRLWRHWKFLAMGRLVVMALMAFELATVEGSIEQIVRDTPFGFRIMLGTVANIWAITAFLHSPVGADDA